MSRKKKVVRQYRLAEATVNRLDQEAIDSGKTKTEILEEALDAYFNQEEKSLRIAEKVMELYDERYKNYMTRIRLGVRTADLNSQLLIELWNTLLLQKNLRADDYVSSSTMESPVVRCAKQDIKERLAKAKQAKDSKG